MAGNIRWTQAQLQANLKAMPARAQAYLTLTTQQQSAQSETLAKTTAPWTDRSGNARSGLTAEPIVNAASGSYAIVVYHKVNYGIYLERMTGADGTPHKWAVIVPVVQTMTPRFTALANKVLMRIAMGG